MQGMDPFAVHLDGHSVDVTGERLLDVSGNVVPLRAQSFAVLHFLCRHANRVVTKNELLDAVWPDTTVTEDSLVQCIGDIRRALGEKGPDIIKTVPRRGYLLKVAQDASPEARPDENAVPMPGDLPSSAGRKVPISFLAFAVACLALLLLAASLLRADNSEGWRPSIAVTPFKNVTGGTLGDQLAYGFTEDLITDLARYGDLVVIAWDSVAPYEKRDVSPRQVSSDLSVRYVLEGSIRSDGEQSRVSAQLVDGSTGAVVWTGRYDRRAVEIFQVQDEMTALIVNELAGMTGAVLKAERRPTAAGQPRNLEAFGLYAEAVRMIDEFTPHGLRLAEERLNAALAIDPTLARAWYKLAMVHFSNAAYGFTDDVDGSLSSYSEAIQRAANLDPEDALIQAAVASAYVKMGRLDLAREAYRRALILGPNDADTLATIAYTRPTKMQTASEDLTLARRAVQLNPIIPDWYGLAHGYAAYHAGEYQEAINALARIKPGTSDAHLYRALSFAELGRTVECAQERELLLSIVPELKVSGIVEGDLMREPKAIEHFLSSAKKAGLPL